MQHKFSKVKNGFSLIEVLVALFILTVGITAISVLMIKNIKNLQLAKNQIIASVLAQEGIELVRNFKDNGELDIQYKTLADTDYNLIVDYNMNKLKSGGAIADKKLNLKNGFYEHSGGTGTKFYRKVSVEVTGNINASPSTREIKATVTVAWDEAAIIAAGDFPSPCNIENKCLSVESMMPDQEKI